MIRNILLLYVITMLSLPRIGAAQATYEDLLRAAQRGSLGTVQDLVAKGMDLDTADPAGNTLLMMAAREGHSGVVGYLIGRKARINAQNGAGETPIMLAALRGHLGVVQLLQANGADIDHRGWAPLHYCAWEGHADICKFLVDHGASVDALSPNRTSPLMMAARQGPLEVAQLLFARSANTCLRHHSR